MSVFSGVDPRWPNVNVSVASAAGAYTVGSASFFRYIVRLGEAVIPLKNQEREALEMLAAIPHAFFDDHLDFGRGWRIVPPASLDDWPVLESSPQRLRSALETARRLLWENAGSVGISAGEIVGIEAELDQVLAVLQRAEAAGVSVNVSYVG